MFKKIFKLTSLVFITLFLASCEKKISKEPTKIHWDRDMCHRCKMVISERNHAVQVINQENGKVYKFDDIGCVPLWFEEEKIPWKQSAKIWVTDIKTSRWIDAKTAYYDTMNNTPMGYGFGAHEKKEDIKEGYEILNFEEVSKRAFTIGK